MHVLIAGGGIAGLTAAIAFARRGATVEIFEQAPALEEVGAGLQISPNASRILERLGVLEKLLPAALEPAAIVLYHARDLSEIARVPLKTGTAGRWEAPYLAAHRADLQQALAETAAEIETIALRLGRTAAACERDGNRVRLLTGTGEMATGDLVVAADGVASRLRRAALSRNAASVCEDLAWRGTVEAEGAAGRKLAALCAKNAVCVYLDRRFHLVAYPVRAGGAFNLAAFTRSANGNGPAALARAMRGAAAPLRALVEAVPDWTTWPLRTVDPAIRWTFGRLALIGDAAHAVTPFAAQGAAMAIEDAETLAGAACRAPDLEAALCAWEAARRPRIARVRQRGALNELAWHAAGPVALARDAFLRLRSPDGLAADMDWLYGWRPPQAERQFSP